MEKEAERLLKDWTAGQPAPNPPPDYRETRVVLPFDPNLLDPELFGKYRAAIKTVTDLESLQIPPRAELLGHWLREGDLGFIYGERGIGKTWLVCAIASCVSSGCDLDTWQAHGSFPVLYIDGEMPLDLTRDRLSGLCKANKTLSVLHHEVLFNEAELAINVAASNTQRVITELCITGAFKLLILDNLSCLASGMKENDADEWEKLLTWLLELRRRRIAVIIVHHSGRSGLMRGTTKREDSAAWIIKVDQSSDDPEDATAKFNSLFEKKPRSITQSEWIRSWTFKTEHDAIVTFSCEEKSNECKVLELVQNGLGSATDIALELGLTKGTISKLAKKLISKNLISIKGRAYVPRGFMARNET
jgi:RecA-family ATPase